jgi:hypothetical protein
VASLGSVVEITTPADRVRLAREARPPRQSLLDRVEATEHGVRLHLAEGAAAADPYPLAASPGTGTGGDQGREAGARGFPGWHLR